VLGNLEKSTTRKRPNERITEKDREIKSSVKSKRKTEETTNCGKKKLLVAGGEKV